MPRATHHARVVSHYGGCDLASDEPRGEEQREDAHAQQLHTPRHRVLEMNDQGQSLSLLIHQTILCDGICGLFIDVL